jgi:4,5-DOPA dioxygenase extradiol
VDPYRGIDTSVWGILIHMFPEAKIPVIEISLSFHIDTIRIIEVGKSIAFLRNEGILIIGSGGLVHNLYEMSKNIDTKAPLWAMEADKKIAAIITSGNAQALSEYVLQNLRQSLAIPTPEHILPAIAILGLMQENDRARFIYEAFQNSTLSLRSFIIEQNDREGR